MGLAIREPPQLRSRAEVYYRPGIIPAIAQIEAGLGAIDDHGSAADGFNRLPCQKRRREEHMSGMASALTSMAENISHPQSIVIQHSASVSANDGRPSRLQEAMEVASTVTSLLRLEKELRTTLKGLISNNPEAEETEVFLKKGLLRARKMIEEALSEHNSEGASPLSKNTTHL